MPTIREELSSILGMAIAMPGYQGQAELKLIARRVDSLPDPDWDRLSRPTQTWLNAAMDCMNSRPRRALPPIPEMAIPKDFTAAPVPEPKEPI